MKSIFWDTNLFIYLLEDSPKFGQAVDELRRRMLRRNDRLFTSAMTVGEVLVKPLRLAAMPRWRTAIERYFAVHISPYRHSILRAAEAYAHIRQDRSIHPADAIQLACAESAEADLFITNDDRLSQKNIPGVSFFISQLKPRAA